MKNNTFLELKKTEAAVAKAYNKWKAELSPAASHAYALFSSSVKSVSRSYCRQFEKSDLVKFSNDANTYMGSGSSIDAEVVQRFGNLVAANLEKINQNVCLSVNYVVSDGASFDYFVINDGPDDFGQNLILFEITSHTNRNKFRKKDLERFLLGFLAGYTRISYGKRGINYSAIPGSSNDDAEVLFYNTGIAYVLTSCAIEHFEADFSTQMKAS